MLLLSQPFPDGGDVDSAGVLMYLVLLALGQDKTLGEVEIVHGLC